MNEQNKVFCKLKLLSMKNNKWFHGVMVSPQDFESCDPSSNLGETCKLFNAKKYMKFCWYYET